MTKKNKFSKNVVSLDPGVRTFQTIYTPNGTYGKLGDETYKRLKKIYTKEDNFKSKLTKSSGNKKYNLRKRCSKLRTKVKNIVHNLHYKTASWLCENFRTIIIPDFKTQNMVKKGKSLNKITKRSLLSLSHYKFRQRLIHKAKITGSKVIVCQEPYTSKTCGQCGKLNSPNHTINCSCGYNADRDINAARNILMRYIALRVRWCPE